LKIIVGLGNPGRKYNNTRHNIGYMVIDRIAEKLGIIIDQNAFSSKITSFMFFKQKVLLVKPVTYMNRSGEAIRDIINYFKITKEDLLIIYDDMDLSPGMIRLRLSGTSGAHKGMQNIIDNLNTNEIKRIRVGIGKPIKNGAEYVLKRPKKTEQTAINFAINKASNAVLDYLKNDFMYAMNRYNGVEENMD
jgi:peptidyl-tRNA hydrolase, PTH1 family